MKNLLKNEFFIIRKSFLIKIALILGAVFGLFSVAQALMFSNFGEGRPLPEGTEQPDNSGRGPGGFMSIANTGKSIFSSSFGLGIGFGLIIAILLAIMVVNEFKNGTIRNKIIAGNKKSTVYLSLIISYISVGIIFMLAYSLVRLLAGSALLGYSEDVAFSATEFWYIIKTMGLSCLVYIVVFSLSVLIASLLKNTGTAIISIIGMVLLFSVTTNLNQLISDWTWLETFCDFNPVNMLSVIADNSFSTSQLLITILGSIGFSAAAISAGALLFRRNDLK